MSGLEKKVQFRGELILAGINWAFPEKNRSGGDDHVLRGKDKKVSLPPVNLQFLMSLPLGSTCPHPLRGGDPNVPRGQNVYEPCPQG